MAQGAVFGQYLLLGRLNRGGMAEVFLARGLRPGQGDVLFAVKRTLPDLSKDRDFVSMFVDEASIARGLVHPHICQIHDQGEVDGQLYIAMEFIHGKDLKVVQHRMRERNESMPYRYTAFALARIAQALDFAHQKQNAAGESEGIVHRDVSPQNVLLSYDGVPKLIDFGIAKAKSRLARTQVGILKGKLAYMSPEQASGQEIDHRADIFALGIVLYELVTGRSPFKGSSDWSTLQRLTAGRHQPPRDLAPDLPARLDGILARALAPSLHERYGRASELAADLDAFCEEDGREVSPASLSAFMRKLFRDDYIREAGRIRTFLAIDLPGSERSGARGGDDTVDVTVVAPSFIEPGQDSHDREVAARKPDGPAPAEPEMRLDPRGHKHPESTLVLPLAASGPAPAAALTGPDSDGFDVETDEIIPPELGALVTPAPPAGESAWPVPGAPDAPELETNEVASPVPGTPPPSTPELDTDEVAAAGPGASVPAAQGADSTPVEPPSPQGGFTNERTLVIDARGDDESGRLEAGPPPPTVPVALGHDPLVDTVALPVPPPAAPRPRDDLDTCTVVEPEAGGAAPGPMPLAPMPLPMIASRPPEPLMPTAVATDASPPRLRAPTPLPRTRAPTPAADPSAPRPRVATPMPRMRAPTPPSTGRAEASTTRRRRTRTAITAGELAVLLGAAMLGAGIVLGVYFAGGRWPW